MVREEINSGFDGLSGGSLTNEPSHHDEPFTESCKYCELPESLNRTAAERQLGEPG